MVSNMNAFSNETLGVIFREKGSLGHYKGINKILMYEEDLFFTGGRDGIIKLWQNNRKDKNFELLNNLEHHIDWVNDLCLSKRHNLLFSCSNDKTINIWKVPGANEYGKKAPIAPMLHNLNAETSPHKDYVSSLCYNEATNNLFSCGYDGSIISHNIEEYGETSSIKLNKESNLIYSSQGNSIYAIDCDLSGNLLLASLYENTIVGIDIRQKRDTLHLRGHKDIVRHLKLSADGKIGLSVSSDKTVKLWDMRSHKVLKNWEFHTDSVHALYVNDNFTKILTGSRNGEVYLTVLPLGCFYNIDKVNEPITSLTMNSDMEILASTSKSKLYEYKFKNVKTIPKLNGKTQLNPISDNSMILTKTIHQANSNSNVMKFSVNFHNEIINYHLMKNKVYIVCSTNEKFIFYNIMKLKKIAEMNIRDYNNMSFEKLVEILDQYDIHTLKSWFTVDIKLGVISITFQKENLFNNLYNFDKDFLEKVLEKTNYLLKISQPLDFKFIPDLSGQSSTMSQSFNNRSSDLKSDFREKGNCLNNTLQIKRTVQSSFDKNSSSGNHLLKTIFANYSIQVINNYLKFFETNFYDTKEYLKNWLMKFDSVKNMDLTSPGSSMQNFFIFSTSEDRISVGPYFEEVTNEFSIPSFVLDILQIPCLNISPPPNTKREKMEVVLDNKRSDIRNKNNSNENDELEAYGYVSVESFKKWLINSYIDMDHIKNVRVKEEMVNLNLKEKQVKYLQEKYLEDPNFYFNVVDFYLANGVYVKNPQITIHQLKEILFPNKTLTITLKYAPIYILIERKVIKIPS